MEYLKKHKKALFITFIVALLFITNYIPGTYLSGWDNLQTELSPWLAVKRAFFSVWEEYQSLGLVAGMGHAADLVRAIFVWLLAFILPNSIIRYTVMFTMTLLGGLGSLKLLTFLSPKENRFPFALIGAIFYLFNFATIQILYVPFEAFSVFYAALPWLIWIFMEIVTKPTTKRTWLLFVLINILATPFAVAQQLFLVYILVLGAIFLAVLVIKKDVNTFKKGFFSFLGIGLIHSFWLLPQLYFLVDAGSVVREAKMNQLATEDVFYNNLDKGNIFDFLTLKGFFYDLLDKNGGFLFASWKVHFDNFFIQLTSIIFIGITFLGFAYKSKYKLAFILVFLLIMVGLLTNVFPFSTFNELLRSNEFINQIFRSPFTKFVIPYSLVASYLFAGGTYVLYEFFKKIFNHNAESSVLKNIITAAILILILCYSFPSFRGQYISSEMKVKIPKSYFETMDYFKHVDKNKRIALLPEHTFWGWFFQKWGYNGSGFLWYGIEQPIISRTFDVWSLKSESYFWELRAALEAEDVDRFNAVLEKYNVNYILLDNSLLPISSTLKGLQYDRTEKVLDESHNVHLVKHFDNIYIYQVSSNKKVDSFVSLSNSLPNIGPTVKVMNHDSGYSEVGTYKTDQSQQYQEYFPFSDLMSQTRTPGKQWSITEDAKNFILTTTIPFDLKEYEFSTVSGLEDGISIYNNGVKTYKNTYKTQIAPDGSLIITVPKQQLSSFNLAQSTITNCSIKNGTNSIKNETNKIQITSTNGAVGCFGYTAPYLPQRYGYMVRINNQNIQGRRLFFYVLDDTKKQAFLEDRLISDTQYYILNPKYQYGQGYNFTFQNNSYNTIPAVNELSNLSVYLFPYDEIKNLRVVYTKKPTNPTTFSPLFSVKKYNYYTYTATIDNAADKTLLLNQTFDKGWNAYRVKDFGVLTRMFPFIFGKEISSHFIVNNWENGWELPTGKNEQIVLFFWPQYLEFAGFILLIPIAVFLIRKQKYHHVDRSHYGN